MPVLSAFYWVIMGLIIIAIAFWPARVAARKGHSFLGYFILSLFFFPLAIILAYVVKDVSGQSNTSTATHTTPTE